MARNPSLASCHLQFGPDFEGARNESELPFRILVLGDFSGRSSRGSQEARTELGKRRVIHLDRDNFAVVMERLDVHLPSPWASPGEEPVLLRFRTLDDMHPDRLFATAPWFRSLSQLRSRLLNPATYEDAAAEVRSWLEPGHPLSAPPKAKRETQAAPPAVEERPPLSAASLLDQALEETERRSPRRLEPQALSGGFDWHKLVRDIVEPYLLPAAAPERAGLVACVDAAIARSMSALLHEGSFQRLEAAWRGLQWLLRQLETGPDLKLCLLDVAKQELSDDLVAGAALEASRMYRLVVEQTTATAGGQPWALLVGDYTFDASEGDVRLLGHLARLGAAAGAPFVSAASGQIVGCAAPDQTPDPSEWARPEEETSAEGWSALRQSPESACLGLVWPRFLLRLPYGKKTDPIETFEYEEMPGEPHHNDYLWGNPALVCAAMLGQAFSRSGWAMRAGEVARLSGLPVHVCRVDGEPRAQPCGELLLNERAIQTVAGYGLMPLVSFRGRDEVALASFQSLNNGPLGGRWR